MCEQGSDSEDILDTRKKKPELRTTSDPEKKKKHLTAP